MCRQVLPAYWFGDWHWAAAHVLCLVGAVLGSVASFAWQAHANSVTEGGAPTWLVSFLPCQNYCSRIQTAIGPCMLVSPAIPCDRHLGYSCILLPLTCTLGRLPV